MLPEMEGIECFLSSEWKVVPGTARASFHFGRIAQMVPEQTCSQKQKQEDIARGWQESEQGEEMLPTGDCPRMCKDLLESDKAHRVRDRTKSCPQNPICASLLMLSPIWT